MIAPREKIMCVTGQLVYSAKECRPLKPGESLSCVDSYMKNLERKWQGAWDDPFFGAYKRPVTDSETGGVGCRLTK